MGRFNRGCIWAFSWCSLAYASATFAFTGTDLFKQCSAALAIEEVKAGSRSALTLPADPTVTIGLAASCRSFIYGYLGGFRLMKDRDFEEYVIRSGCIPKEEPPATATKQLRPQNHCTPENVTEGQLIRVVHKYLAAHPEYHHKHGSILVNAALAGAFPCVTK